MPTKSVEALLKEKKIFEIVNPKCTKAATDLSVRQVIDIMRSAKSGYCVMTDGKQLRGIFTEVDLVRRVLSKDADLSRPVSDFMTTEVKVLTPENSVRDAIELMGKNRFYHIPLVNENQDLVGILSVRTLIRFLAAYYPTEIYNLPPNPDQIMGTQEGG